MVTRLILSIDRRNTSDQAMEVVDLAINFHERGVVGVDICGDPSIGDVSIYRAALARAKGAGLGITIHFAEVPQPPTKAELETMLELRPDRLGHVIHVPRSIKEIIAQRRLGLELCLSCNVKLKMMEGSYEDHHFRYWRETGCPITLCVCSSIFSQKGSDANDARLMTLEWLEVRCQMSMRWWLNTLTFLLKRSMS